MDSITRKPPQIKKTAFPPKTLAGEPVLSYPKPPTDKNGKYFNTKSPLDQSLFTPKFFPEKKKKRKILKKTILFLFSLIFIIGIVVGSYFFWKIESVSSKINNETPRQSVLSTLSNLAQNERATLDGENEGRINILLLGAAGKGRAGGNLTDTIMIASIDTINNKTALLSLPRDLYTEIPNSAYSTKINSIYKYGLNQNLGIEPIKKTVENITGLKINYYLVATFEGFEKFVDDIDGVIINVERDIYDPNYPGLNYSYELFALEKGTHLLDGSTALKYARERHDDPEGDFGRAKRQQQILQAVKSRVFSTKILFNPFALNSLLNTLGESITTDITLEEIESFLHLAKELDTQNVNNVVIDAWKKDSLLKVSHIFYENIRAFILVPRVGNYSEIQEIAENIFDLEKIKRAQAEITKEDASIAVINQSGDSAILRKIENLFENKMSFKNVSAFQGTSNMVNNFTQVTDFSLGKKPFTLNEIVQKLPAQLINDYALENTDSPMNRSLEKFDFVVIIGSDLIAPYSFQDNTIQELEASQKNEEGQEILIQKK